MWTGYSENCSICIYRYQYDQHQHYTIIFPMLARHVRIAKSSSLGPDTIILYTMNQSILYTRTSRVYISYLFHLIKTRTCLEDFKRVLHWPLSYIVTPCKWVSIIGSCYMIQAGICTCMTNLWRLWPTQFCVLGLHTWKYPLINIDVNIPQFSGFAIITRFCIINRGEKYVPPHDINTLSKP